MRNTKVIIMFLLLYNSSAVFKLIYEYLCVCAGLEGAGDGQGRPCTKRPWLV